MSLEPENKNINNETTITDTEFWTTLISNSGLLEEMKAEIEFLLHQYGTVLPCNRFDVGNCIEFAINRLIKMNNFQTLQLPNAKRVDIEILNYKKLSIKYSSCGDITLHNSNSTINTDLQMKDTLLLTGEKLYLLTQDEFEKYNINIDSYLKNTGDSLKLKRKILTYLDSINYPFVYFINIVYIKDECQNNLCSELFYKHFLEQFRKHQINSGSP